MNTCLTICADDYAQHEAISRGVVQLLKAERLTAVSCMVTTPLWFEHATWLDPFHQTIDIGLHVNLTALGEGGYALSSLLARSQCHLVRRRTIWRLLEAQLSRFVEARKGAMPDFIDGHQHIQNFPVVQDIFLDFYRQHFAHLNPAPYIRCSWQRLGYGQPDLLSWMKAQIIAHTGARGFKAKLLRHRIPHHAAFAGIYHLSATSSDYHTLFDGFVRTLARNPNGLLMTHPACFSAHANFMQQKKDMPFRVRQAEYDYLSSDRMLQVLAQYGVRLMPKRWR